MTTRSPSLKSIISVIISLFFLTQTHQAFSEPVGPLHKSEPEAQTHQYICGEAAKIWPGTNGQTLGNDDQDAWTDFFVGPHHEIWNYIGARTEYSGIIWLINHDLDIVNGTITYGGRHGGVITDITWTPPNYVFDMPYSEFNEFDYVNSFGTHDDGSGENDGNDTVGSWPNVGDDIIEGVHEEDSFFVHEVFNILYDMYGEPEFNPDNDYLQDEFYNGLDWDGAETFYHHLWRRSAHNDSDINMTGVTRNLAQSPSQELDFIKDIDDRHPSPIQVAEAYWKLSVDYYKGENGRDENKGLAYYFLGRIAHLLIDMCVPAHAHCDPHAPVWGWADAYEGYMGDVNQYSSHTSPTEYNIGDWKYSEFNYVRNQIPGTKWEPDDPDDQAAQARWDSQSDLFKLFWSTAEIGDNYDSNDVDGEVDQGTRRDWELIGGWWTEEELDELAEILMPQAMVSVAELYKLFWDTVSSASQVPLHLEWDKAFGGENVDNSFDVAQTQDGGYIVVGYTRSYGAGDYDVWLIKTDSIGNIQWDKTFGGSASDTGVAVEQTQDGGYITVGGTMSYGAGAGDIWLVKTDANGNIQWDRTFGGPDYEDGWDVEQIEDGGYIIVSRTRSFGVGGYDVWLIKTDANGNEVWTDYPRTFGGSAFDVGNAVEQTLDGGYIIAGSTESFGAGGYDVWLIKTNENGDRQWDRTFGGAYSDGGWDVEQTEDGGYIVTGHIGEDNSDTDVWLIKTDANGNEVWTDYPRTFGGSSIDYGTSVLQARDGGYVIAGFTRSFGIGGAGNYDTWFIKTDSSGNKEWDDIFDGASFGAKVSVRQTSDYGYVIASRTHDDTLSVQALIIKIGITPCFPYYKDEDDDQYGIDGDMLCLYGPSHPYTTILAGDCDDTDSAVNPVTVEVTCNDMNDDCNETTPDDFNDDGDPVSMCQGDCDDNDQNNYPGNQEVCDGQDNNCDEVTDEAGAVGCTTYHRDEDQDGYGIAGDSECLCAPSIPYTATLVDDCDDTDPDVNPAATEIICNGKDDDCTSGTPDDFNIDGDPVSLCAGDCDDNDPNNYPGNPEVCGDGIDNDCDFLADADDPDCQRGLSHISLASPSNESVLYSPPTFSWTSDGGSNNRFVVDLFKFPSGPLWTAPIVSETSWTMPTMIWNLIPSGSYIVWRARGADLDDTPLTIITSDEIWWFYKP